MSQLKCAGILRADRISRPLLSLEKIQEGPVVATAWLLDHPVAQPGTLVPPRTRFRAYCLRSRPATLGGQEGR